MEAEEIVFDLVLATTSDYFLKWFFHDWELHTRDRIKYEYGDYRYSPKLLKPTSEPVSVAKEILFLGYHPELYYPKNAVFEEPLIIDYRWELYEPENFGVGLMTILDIAADKVQIQAFAYEGYSFTPELTAIGHHITKVFPPLVQYYKYGKPGVMEKPTSSDPDEKWIEYYHWCKWEAGVRYTFEDMGRDRSLTASTIRKRHIGCFICKEHRRQINEKKEHKEQY